MTPAAVLAFPEIDPLDRLAATANAAHVEGCAGFIRQAIIAGQALIEAKKLVGHGGWTQWVAENCVFSDRTAQVYMQAARNPQRAADSIREALRHALGDKRAADLQEPLDHPSLGSGAADLRVCSCIELFESGIKPGAVITEPPDLVALSGLAQACIDVPLVAVKVRTRELDAIFRLCGALAYRGANIRDNRLILVFGRDDAFERAKARPVPGPTSLRPYLSWTEYFVQRLADSGELVCDPFLRPETALAAVEFGRRFVGCSLDASVVADTRRQIGTELQ